MNLGAEENKDQGCRDVIEKQQLVNLDAIDYQNPDLQKPQK